VEELTEKRPETGIEKIGHMVMTRNWEEGQEEVPLKREKGGLSRRKIPGENGPR